MHVRKKDLNKKNEEKLLGMGTCKKADTPFQLHEEVGRDSNVALAIGVVFGSDAFTCFPRLLSAAIPGAKLLQGWGFPAKVSLRFMVLFFVLVTYPNARNYQTSAQFNASYESISCVWSCSYKQTFLGDTIKSAILAMVLYSHSTM
jgi:hypothetical protein